MTARILIVEDNPLNVKLLASLLRLDHHTIIVADDAEKALLLALAEPPDLVLMDLQLPGMDGLTATRRFKQEEALRRVPVIALTAHAMAGDAERALEAGCSGYITKPIDTRTFRKVVAAYLERVA